MEICKTKKKTLVHITLEHGFHLRVLCTNDSSSSFSATLFVERDWNSRWAYWRKINRIDQKFHLSIPFSSACTEAHSNKTHPEICRVRPSKPLISVVSILLSHIEAAWVAASSPQTLEHDPSRSITPSTLGLR